VRFDFHYGSIMGPFMSVLGMGPRFSHIDVDDSEVRVQLGWGFRATVPRSSITGVTLPTKGVISRGAHGWGGRWLVNGAGSRLVQISIDPVGRGRVIGFPVRLRELTVSAEHPTELAAALAQP